MSGKGSRGRSSRAAAKGPRPVELPALWKLTLTSAAALFQASERKDALVDVVAGLSALDALSRAARTGLDVERFSAIVRLLDHVARISPLKLPQSETPACGWAVVEAVMLAESSGLSAVGRYLLGQARSAASRGEREMAWLARLVDDLKIEELDRMGLIDVLDDVRAHEDWPWPRPERGSE